MNFIKLEQQQKQQEQEQQKNMYYLFLGIMYMTEGETRLAKHLDYKRTTCPHDRNGKLQEMTRYYRLKWIVHPFEQLDENDFFSQVKKEYDFFCDRTEIERKRITLVVRHTL